MTITDVGDALRRRKTSCVQLVEECLARIEEKNPDLNAFITVMANSARSRAAELDKELANGIDRGPLHGIPIAHKDLICVKGQRCTSGSKVFEDYVPDFDATVAVRLHEAGAVTLGKTGLHEIAYGITSANPHFGVIRNSHDRERIPGGSSGGSGVAVSTGMALMATGTDTGGSIRIPASFCGVAGLKPTYGRVSRFGVKPLGMSLDHIGPLAQTVRDAAIAYHAMAGYDNRDPSSSRRPVSGYVPPAPCSIAGLRIGIPMNYYLNAVDPEVREAFDRMARLSESLGARMVSVKAPDVEALNVVARTLLLVEASAVYEPYLADREKFGDDVLALLDQGRLVPATAYVNAQRLRRHFIQEWRLLFDAVDCLLTPTTPTAAPLIGQKQMELDGEVHDVRLATTRFMRGINVLGLPALSIPCGKTAGGLPMGLQIVGRAFEEDMVLRVGAALEDEIRDSTLNPHFPIVRQNPTLRVENGD
jgi:aspartyl-tRNA(Asn)/glutamyl-tRNA(Gln) amidotransferase subunit A